jgi:DNA-binding NarL/FixJ family response regulator
LSKSLKKGTQIVQTPVDRSSPLPITVVIADDHPIMRQSMRQLLMALDTITIVGEAQNGQEALQLVRKLQPDVAVLDAVMPLLDGIHVAHQIAAARYTTRVLIVSVHESYSLARFSLRQGALGYLAKSTLYEELAVAIAAVYHRQEYVSPYLLAQSKKETDL